MWESLWIEELLPVFPRFHSNILFEQCIKALRIVKAGGIYDFVDLDIFLCQKLLGFFNAHTANVFIHTFSGFLFEDFGKIHFVDPEGIGNGFQADILLIIFVNIVNDLSASK